MGGRLKKLIKSVNGRQNSLRTRGNRSQKERERTVLEIMSFLPLPSGYTWGEITWGGKYGFVLLAEFLTFTR